MIMFMWIMVVLIVTVQLHTDESQISVGKYKLVFFSAYNYINYRKVMILDFLTCEVMKC